MTHAHPLPLSSCVEQKSASHRDADLQRYERLNVSLLFAVAMRSRVCVALCKYFYCHQYTESEQLFQNNTVVL